MSSIKRIIAITLILGMVTGGFAPAAVAEHTDTTDSDENNGDVKLGEGNYVCAEADGADDDDTVGNSALAHKTALGHLVGTVVSAIVFAGGLIGVVGGTIYTVAEAARPGGDDYGEKRKKAVLYGFGALFAMYGLNAIASSIAQQYSFTCLLPGF